MSMKSTDRLDKPDVRRLHGSTASKPPKISIAAKYSLPFTMLVAADDHLSGMRN